MYSIQEININFGIALMAHELKLHYNEITAEHSH